MESPDRLTTVLRNNWTNWGLRIYPNPAREAINLEFDFPILPGAKMYLFDTYGHLIKQIQLQRQLSLSHFDNGVYWLVVINGKNRWRKRMIVH